MHVAFFRLPFFFSLSKVLFFSLGARLDKSDALRARLLSLPGFLCYFVLTSQLTIFLAPHLCNLLYPPEIS